jgi:hypothetical protein
MSDEQPETEEERAEEEEAKEEAELDTEGMGPEPE